MGKFSDRREPHTKERPKSVLKRHSNSCLTHELYEHWGGLQRKSRNKTEEIKEQRPDVAQ